ncbi:hypothetical protein OCU04_012508 [Sclerotinia nivalis]|uniref:C3H1-type domain-containing protein n=1 Tax=Sclerotinia nivalis TaxID=352851 RepID=A0A9X0A929_9HELO|nr:hypothetical protein OCU04_012508 [Sclerotinia nivalis]
MSTKLNKRETPARDRSVQDLSVSPRGPRPGYFIVRKSGEVVPLVAVDELPLGVDLVGVPRSLDLVETGGMLNLGLQGGGGEGFYGLVGLEEDGEEEDVVTGNSGFDTAVSSPLILPIRSSTMATQPTPPSSKQHFPPGFSTSIHAPSPLSNPRIQNHSISSLGTQQQAQQQTCRHWCTHNRRCKWGDNCRYKHVMPRTRFELGLIGLSDWPDWFKKENLGFFPEFGVRRGRGLDRLDRLGDGGLQGDGAGGMERMERGREKERSDMVGGIVGREVREREMERAVEMGMGMGILEGERVLERLREMEKLLKLKGVSGKSRDKNADSKLRDEKRIKEKEKEKMREKEREKERDREEKLEIRRTEAKKERERLRSEKAREKEVSGRIDRGDAEGARRWEDDSVDEEFSGDGGKGGMKGKGREEGKERIEKGGKESASAEKEKLVDV